MLVTGITGTMGMYQTPNSATKTTKTGDEVQFNNNVMKCTAVGNHEVMLCSDALMSYGSPQTGESVNIYKSEHYSKDNPVYLINGLDAKGNPFEQEVDASKINPNHCSYNEMMVLNVETGHTSSKDFLKMAAVRDKAGTNSYFDAADYISYAKDVMNDMKTLGNWASYLSYDKWIGDILKYTNRE